jgi:hypothetical protein
MGATKHEKTFVDFEKPYEQNLIGLKGVMYFGIGLLLLILITFGLMYVLLWQVLEVDAVAEKSSDNPMIMSDRDRLPPEPRLQSAPGFGVEGPNGPVNLELREPQAEYRELKKIWDEEIKKGQIDPTTGAMITMPIDKAIDKFMQQPMRAQTGPEAEKAAKDSRLYYTDASAGRKAAEKRR